jgi:hypothetical protein
MHNSELVSSVDRYLQNHPGMFYQWYTLDFHEQDRYSRLNMTFLYLLYGSGNGKTMLRRVVSLPRNDRPTREPYILYTTARLPYRIKSGSRAGQMMFLEELRPDESVVSAGLFKYIREGRSPDCINPQGSSDQTLYYTLGHFFETVQQGGVEIRDTMQFPEFHIMVEENNDQLFPRQNQETLRYLQGLPGFSNDKPMHQAYVDCLYGMGVRAQNDRGEVRIALPYRHAHGRGVRVAGREILSRWYFSPTITVDEVHPEVEFHLRSA